MIPTEILNYRLIRRLGCGGMGQVFLAQNKNINQLVAIKSLHPQFANNIALRARFKQEAIMLSSLDHPNIVKFLNYVENEYGVFLIMEYVEGDTLEDFINKKNGLIVEKRAYPIMCEILDAFSYAHEHGIVHRDIKPGNIFINDEGHIKVMDFGIAQILSEVDGGKSGPVMGTPEYMSPEQVFGHTIDHRSDVYSLGVLLHQMLTGRAPYDATTLSELEIKRRVINEALPRMKEYYPYVSEGLQKIVDKATSKSIESRYSDCGEMKKAIKQVVDPDPINRTLLYGGIAIAVVIAGVLFGVWDYYRTKIYYYKDYAEFYGVPEGIHELSSREMSHRERTYRMEYSRYKLRRLSLVNSKGKTVSHSDTEYQNSRYTDVEYFYTDNGQIDYKKVYNEYGRLLFKLDYDENLKTATFKYDDEYGTAMRLQSSTTELYVDKNDGSIDRSRISRYLLHYNEESGLLEQMIYAGGDNNDRVGDQDNIYGQGYEYDSKGRVTTVKFFGRDGNVHGNKIGLGIKKYTYNEDDDWSSVSYFSPDGNPSHDGNNCTLVTLDYDKWGNRISEMYTTIDGKPTVRTDMALFGIKYEYDDDGCRIKEICVDGSGNQMLNRYGWAFVEMAYDGNGFQTESKFYDLNGEPACNINGGDAVSAYKFKPNDKGLNLESSYYDKTGALMELGSGMARNVFEYDSVGNLTKIIYYDSKGNPAPFNGFNTSLTCEYDDFNREIKRRYYDAKGNLTDGGDGTTGYNVEYDTQGNVYRYIYVGKDGKSPVRCNRGFAYIVYKYDEVGNNILREFCDEKGGNCLNAYGIHKVEQVYDSKTNFLKEERFYGLSELKSTNHYEYDERGNIIKSYTTNASGHLQNGAVVTCKEYDKNNRISREWYTNLDGRKINCQGKKYSQAKFSYDERGNVTELVFLNASDGAGMDEMGTHRRIRQYNAINEVVYEKNIGVDGEPISGRDASPEGRVTYDERGNQTSISCFDGYGKPCLGKSGYHKIECTYNERNKVLTCVTTDTKGNLIKNKDNGYARQVNTYDNKGNRTSEKYYSENNVLDYELRCTYNVRNMEIKLMVCDGSGHMSDKKLGFGRCEISYQENGIIPVQRKYYSSAGKLIATQKFNAKKNEWNNIDMAGGSSQTLRSVGWQEKWSSLQRETPIVIADGFLLMNIVINDTKVDMNIKMTEISKSDIEGNIEQVKEGMRQFRNLFRKQTDMPSYINLNLFLFDKNMDYVFVI